MVEQYSKGLSPVKMEMGFPEKTQDFMLEMIRMILDALVVITLIICSSIVVTTGLKPIVWGMPLISLIGYSVAALMLVINLIKRLRKRKRR